MSTPRKDARKTSASPRGGTVGSQKPERRRRLSDLSPPPIPERALPSSASGVTQNPAAVPKLPSSTTVQRIDVGASIASAAKPFSRNDFQQRLGDLLFQSPGTWRDREQLQAVIGEKILRTSRVMSVRNFQKIAREDLQRMAEFYDAHFFQGLCLPLASSYGLSFRLSSRMTRAGGKTTRTIQRSVRGSSTHFEIALSTSLLFQSFRNPKDSIRVCGYQCRDRLTAMQRIVEHELIHLGEMLVWIHSDCSAGRFQSIARNMFGHTEHRHELITQQERAAKEFNIRNGMRVRFQYDGKPMVGIVNRITRRATILVESPHGARYKDGKRYLKYYVPIQHLRPIA